MTSTGLEGGARPIGRIGRYLVFQEIATGGMATVYFGRLEGASGFARVVALKRLHPHIWSVPEATAMLRDEAWLSARVRHPNVLSVLDVVESGNELVLVMEYVEGVALSRLLRRLQEQKRKMPLPIAVAVLGAMLAGLEAAHAATAEDGSPLGLIHRDVTPHNVLVGLDGTVRLGDFGVAKARGRLLTTQNGELKGKFPYMAPEQVKGESVTAQTDLFAVGLVLFECLAGRRLREETEPAAILTSILYGAQPDIRALCPDTSPDVIAAMTRALEREPSGRFRDAREMAQALEGACVAASPRELSDFVTQALGDETASMRRTRERIERATVDEALVPTLPSSAERGTTESATVTSAKPAPSLRTIPAVPPATSATLPVAEKIAAPTPSSQPLRLEEQPRATDVVSPARRSPLIVVAALLAAMAVATFTVLLVGRHAPGEPFAVTEPDPGAPVTPPPPSAPVPESPNEQAAVAPSAPPAALPKEGADTARFPVVQSSSTAARGPGVSGKKPLRARPARSAVSATPSATATAASPSGLAGIPSDRDPH